MYFPSIEMNVWIILNVKRVKQNVISVDFIIDVIPKNLL